MSPSTLGGFGNKPSTPLDIRLAIIRSDHGACPARRHDTAGPVAGFIGPRNFGAKVGQRGAIRQDCMP